METVPSKYDETGAESGHLPATDTDEGKGQGGEILGASLTDGLQNRDALLAAENKHNVQPQQHELSEFAEQRIRSLSSPRLKARGLPLIDHSAGQGDQTAGHPAIVPGMLPPLNIRGDTGRDKQISRPKTGDMSFKNAATAVVSAATMRNFRRNSAAMHVDLLRVFVPDMLINVSAMDVKNPPSLGRCLSLSFPLR